jgi:hypothetical protein
MLMRSWFWSGCGLVVVVAACHSSETQPVSGTAATAIDPATATDGQRDADESDVDCGGSITPKCGAGAACVNDLNCASGLCTAGVCAAVAGEAEAGVPNPEPDCTITNTCAPTGPPSASECNQGSSNDPTICPPDIH